MKYISSLLLISIFVGCGGGGGEAGSSSSFQPVDKEEIQDTPKDIVIDRDELKNRVRSIIDSSDNHIGESQNLYFERGDVDIIYIGEKYESDNIIDRDTNKTYSFGDIKIDTSKEGEQSIDYFINNDHTLGLKKYIIITKNTPPKLELIGNKEMTIYLGEPYNVPFVKASDREEFDTISSKIVVSGEVDIYRAGRYVIDYKVTDRGGLSDEVSRVVVVKNRDDMKIEGAKKSDLDSIKLLDYLQGADKIDISIYNNKTKIGYSSRKPIAFGYSVGTKEIIFAMPDDIQDKFVLSLREENEDDSKYDIAIKKVVEVGDELANGCYLSEHFDTISIDNNPYNDVIKIECKSRSVGYYQKGVGLVAQNILLPQTGEDLSLESEDLTGRNLMNIDPLYSLYHLSGADIKVGIVDGGFVLPCHNELCGRVELIKKDDNNITYELHPTHVAGIIGATGKKSDAIGVATSAKLYSLSFYQYNYDVVDMLNVLYDRKIDISNHSYGPDRAGIYEYISQNVDNFIYKHPESIVVNSAGNSREDGNYWTIKDFSSAKNIITVGAVDKDANITSFSCVGPVNSGRIKPDIVAYGLGVDSSDNENGYALMSGTSMSAPHITGLLALLQEEYKRVNYGDGMREDVAKAILANSATDLGRRGPDYEYGYGIPDAKKAVKIIKSMSGAESQIILNSIKEGDIKEYSLRISSDMDVKLNLSWIDPAKSAIYVDDEIHPILNTYLTFKIVDSKNGRVYYPWSLDDDNPTTLAVNDKVNSVDNLQQIEAHLQKGEYKIVIENKMMNIGINQKFALVSNTPISGKALTKEEMKKIEFEYFLMNLY